MLLLGLFLLFLDELSNVSDRGCKVFATFGKLSFLRSSKLIGIGHIISVCMSCESDR